MTRKEIEKLSLDVDANETHSIINRWLIYGIIIICTAFLIVLTISAIQQKDDIALLKELQGEWQCTQWEETSELINCKEINTIKVLESHIKDETRCDLVFGNEWAYQKATFEYPICDVWVNPETMEVTAEINCISKCEKREIICEHKKVCVQEMLVRDVK